MGKLLSLVDLNPTLKLSECSDGFWLYDTTQGMNLSMRAKTPTDAFVKALTYYQGRLANVQQEHSSLKAKVDSFLEQFEEDES